MVAFDVDVTNLAALKTFDVDRCEGYSLAVLAPPFNIDLVFFDIKLITCLRFTFKTSLILTSLFSLKVTNSLPGIIFS